MGLVNANENAVATGGDELPGRVNYFIGNDPQKWRTNVPTYSQVRYRDVYPGIDLVYYGNQSGQLEYDFVVAPGANPQAIALQVTPAGNAATRLALSGLYIDSTGDLVVGKPSEAVTFRKPAVYQPAGGAEARTAVEGHYVLTASNQVQFSLGNYDHSRPLVIDPVLSYSTYLGGSGSEGGKGIAVDSSQNIYVTGWTQSTDFPIENALQPSYAGAPANAYQSGDAFVTKFNSSGSALVYSTYLGGSNADEASGIAVDSAGNAYVTGYTNSTDFPITAAGFEHHLLGSSAAFVTKLNASGSALVYSTYLGGSNEDGASSIAVDSAGDAYITGSTSSTDFPTVNPLQTSLNGTGDAFVTELNQAGSAPVFSTYLGGSLADVGLSIAIDSSGNVYIAGDTTSQDFPTVTPFQSVNKALAGLGTGFVAKLSLTGPTLVYSSYLGGSGPSGDSAQSIAADAAGNAYVTGTTSSVDFPSVNPIPMPITNYGSQHAFVAKVKTDGSALIYSTYLGGNGEEGGTGIALDSAGEAYVTGYTNSTNFPFNNPVQIAYGGGYDGDAAFVSRFNAAGSALIFSTYLGGGSSDAGASYGQGIAVDSFDNAYVTGNTGPGFPLVNALQSTDNATGEFGTAFVAKLSATPAIAVVTSGGLSFGPMVVGTTTPSKNFTLTDTGDATLTISSITAEAGGDFALVTTGTSCPYQGGSLQPGRSCTIDVTFTPTVAGPIHSYVTVVSNGATSPESLVVTGTGTLTAATISPSSLTFSSQNVGTTGPSQPVKLTNTAAAAMAVSSIGLSNGWTETDNCTPTVPANSFCTINVSFSPATFGPLSGSLTVADNAPNSPQTVSLSGTGLGPTANLSATSLSFTGQQLGTSSGAQSVTLTNGGNATLSISSIALSGPNAGDFSFTQTCNGSVPAGGTCQIKVTFTPTASEDRTATVSITDNAPGSPQTITLAGTGEAPGASLSTSSVTFPGQFVGTTGLPQNVVLTNNGNEALSISNIQASAQFQATNGCTSSLAAGVNCTISVFFDPSTGGTQTGTLTITDNAPGSPQTVSLSGAGEDFMLSTTTSSATVPPGQMANYSLSIAPLGGLSQTVSLACNGAPPLATCSVTPNSAMLNGSTATPVSVAVTTTAGSSAGPRSQGLPPSPLSPHGILGIYGLLALLGLAWLGSNRRGRMVWLLAACMILVSLWAACGAGGGMTSVVQTPGTPAGTYSLQITGTASGASNSQLTHTAMLSLTVN